MNVEELSKSSEWGTYRDEILRLYGEERWTLRQVSDRMKEKYGLKKTDRQYKTLLSNNRVKKNQTAATWAAVDRRIKAREGKRSEVFLNGVKIPEEKWERETTRYAYDNHGKIGTSSENEIVVRTPRESLPFDENHDVLMQSHDEALDNEHVKTPWHLTVFTPEGQRLGTWPIGVPEEPRAVEVISNIVPNENYGQEPINIPEEAMDVEDLGDLTILTRRVRQIHLRGTKLLQDVDEETADEGLSSGSTPRTSQLTMYEAHGHPQWIQRPPLCTWTWESFYGIFERCINSPQVARSLRQLCVPTDMTTLVACSKTDLLNFLVRILMEHSKDAGSALSVSLGSWLSLSRHRHLLKLLLSSHNAPLSEAFALGFCHVLYRGYNWRLLDSPDMSGSLQRCIQAFVSKKNVLSMHHSKMLLRWAILWRLPDCIPALLSKSGDSLCTPGLIRSVARYSDEYYPVAELPPRIVALLLNHGASAEEIMLAIVDTHMKKAQRGKDTSKEEVLLLLALSRGVRLDAITSTTKPLSIAEETALRSPALGRILLDWVKNPTSLEVMRILLDSCDAVSLRNHSPAAKELALFSLVRERHCDLDKVKALLDDGTNPDVPTLFGHTSDEERLERNHNPYQCGNCTRLTTASDRGRFSLHRQLDMPIDIAFDLWDQDSAQLLLDFGSSPPAQLLRLSSATSDQHTMEELKYDSWLGCLFGRGPPDPGHQKAVSFMRYISHYFLGNQNIAMVSNVLLQWAIDDEDETLLRGLVEKGVDILQPRLFYDGFEYDRFKSYTPFLLALRVCSLAFVKTMWNLQPYLAASEAQALGAYELVGVCSAILLPDESKLDKIAYLLEIGASPNTMIRQKDSLLPTPLQATLRGHYMRGDWGKAQRARVALETCEYLIRKGADVDAFGSNHVTRYKWPPYIGTRKR